jgi:hypothetical protein
MPVETAKVQRVSVETMCTAVRIAAVHYCLHCDTPKDVDLCCFIYVFGLTIPDFQIMITEPKVKFSTIWWLSYYFKPPRNVESEMSGGMGGGGDALKTKMLRCLNKS